MLDHMKEVLGIFLENLISPGVARTGEVDEAANPNGSVENIAGIINPAGNVLGMMPHPERCCEAVLGGTDGRLLFESLARYLRKE